MSSRIMGIDSYLSPATYYPIRQIGAAEIRRRRYPKGVYDLYHVAEPIAGQRAQFYRLSESTPVTSLVIDGKTWMVDDPPHWWAMIEHARAMRGNVVCAGLGLGLMLHAMLDPRWQCQVDTVTVVERCADAIDLIAPELPLSHKLHIVHADFETWDADRRVDSVLYDLFVGDVAPFMTAKAVKVMFRLHERFPGAACRVHGFNNDGLNEAARHVRNLERLARQPTEAQ